MPILSCCEGLDAFVHVGLNRLLGAQTQKRSTCTGTGYRHILHALYRNKKQNIYRRGIKSHARTHALIIITTITHIKGYGATKTIFSTAAPLR